MRRRMCLLLAFIILVSTSCISAFASEKKRQDLIYGDINTNGNIDVNDVTQLQKYIVGADYITEVPETLRKNLFDLNQDLKVNVIDVTELQRYICGDLSQTRINKVAYTCEDGVFKLENIFEIDGALFEGRIQDEIIIDDSLYDTSNIKAVYWYSRLENATSTCFRALSDINQEDVRVVVNNGNYIYVDDYADINSKGYFMHNEKEIKAYGYDCIVTDENGNELAIVKAHSDADYYYEYQFSVDGYPNVKGSFPIDIYYKDILINRINVKINRSEHLENDPYFTDTPLISMDRDIAANRELRTHCWKADMTDREKLDTLAKYVMDKYEYAEYVCIDGAQDIAIAARELVLESYLLYPGGETNTLHNRYIYTYDIYNSIAQPAGHVAAIVKFKDGSLIRYDVDGDHCYIRNFYKPYK